MSATTAANTPRRRARPRRRTGAPLPKPVTTGGTEISVSPWRGSGAGTGASKGLDRPSASRACAGARRDGDGDGGASRGERRLVGHRDLARLGSAASATRSRPSALVPAAGVPVPGLVDLEPQRDRGDVVLAARGVGGVDERVHRDVQVVVACAACAAIAASSTRPREAVRAEQDHVARARGRRPGVDVDLPVGSQRARDDRALRVLRGLLGRQRAGLDPLGDQRVVVGEARQDAAAPEIGARIADVREGHATSGRRAPP